MRPAEGERVGVLVVELDLQVDGIGLQVDQPAGGGMFRQRHGAPVQVDDQLGRGVELLQLRIAHAVAAAVGVQGMEGPAVAHVDAAEDLVDELGCQGGTVVAAAGHEHRGRAGVGLDIVRVEPQPPQADHVMHDQPHVPRHGDLGHHAQDDDFLRLANVHCLQRSYGVPGGPAAARRRSWRFWISCSWRYRPSTATSSSCVPRCTIRPWSITRIRSARRTVEQAVRDHETRPPGHQAVQGVEDHGLGLGVDRGGWLVENQDRGVFQEGPGDADPLPLAAGNLGTRSPSSVRYCWGRRMMKSWALAARAASTTSSSLASSRP